MTPDELATVERVATEYGCEPRLVAFLYGHTGSIEAAVAELVTLLARWAENDEEQAR